MLYISILTTDDDDDQEEEERAWIEGWIDGRSVAWYGAVRNGSLAHTGLAQRTLPPPPRGSFLDDDEESRSSIDGNEEEEEKRKEKKKGTKMVQTDSLLPTTVLQSERGMEECQKGTQRKKGKKERK